MMPLQRACDAEKQVRNKLSNGPRRAQSNVIFHRVFCDAEGKRINSGDMLVSRQAHGYTVNQGGTADCRTESVPVRP